MDRKTIRSILEEINIQPQGITEPVTIDLLSVIRYRAMIAIQWIIEDTKRGILPATAETFANLHDYMDANMYLLDESHANPKLGSFWEWSELDVQGVCDQFNAVIDIVNDWMASRTYIRQNPG